MKKDFFVLILSAALLGCSSVPMNKADKDDLERRLQNSANIGFIYAQIAENTYYPHNTFKFPQNIENVENIGNDGFGFAYSIFNVKDNGHVKEVVLSFRGTDQIRDWPIGNILALQNSRGLNAYKKLREETPENIPVAVVGHSLGGAIALHVSLREPNVKTFVFNTSSRFTRGKALDNERYSYSEYGEANKILRTFTIDPKWTHTIVGCTLGGPLKNHAQDKLAVCLTKKASQELPDAKMSMTLNPNIFGG